MFEKLIESHINVLSNYHSNELIIYKGFPGSFYLELSKHIPHIVEQIPLKEGNLNLEEIKSNLSKYLKALDFRTPHFIIYEELVCLLDNVNVSLIENELILFENPLFDSIPLNHLSISNFEKILYSESNLQGEDRVSEDLLFYSFYSGLKKSGNYYYAEYKLIDEPASERFTKKEFFSIQSSLAPTFISENDAKKFDNPIIYKENSFYDLLGDIFFEKYKAIVTLNIFIDSIVLLSPYAKSQIEFIKYLFEKNQLNIKFFEVKDDDPLYGREDFRDILQTYWKSDNFRELLFYSSPDTNLDKKTLSQDVIIEDIVSQSENALNDKVFKDLFITSPTGSGKSVFFQIPAIYLHQKHKSVTIVISPLKALMQDQVYGLEKRGVDISCCLNSDVPLNQKEDLIDKIKKGDISLIYLSPEMLLSYDIRSFIGDRKLGLIAVDESHLVTTWGRDFRVDYWYLGTYLSKIRKYLDYKFPIVALTATAVYQGEDDIVFDTINSLNMINPKIYLGNVTREEVNFEINEFKYSGSHTTAKMEKTLEFIEKTVEKDKKAIVYFPFTTQVDEASKELPVNLKPYIASYHSRIDKDEKQTALEDFHSDKVKVVLATKAFGMGIDVSNINYVYHFAPSGTLADYIQEIGRVARTQSIKGYAVIDYNPLDLKFAKMLYGINAIRQYQIRFVLEKLYEIYKKRKKQNMLASTEDFAYIFGEISDLENKVKSTLMLIEKDLLAKHKYNVVVVRPKSLFSKVFACVSKENEYRLFGKYGKYFSKISIQKTNKRNEGNNVLTTDPGDIYELDLQQLWEEKFNDKSFPTVKFNFFSGKLFTEYPGTVFPRYKLEINLGCSVSELNKKVNNYFEAIESVIYSFGPSTFTKKEFEYEISKEIDFKMAKRITNLIFNLYTEKFGPDVMGQKKNREAFIQERKVPNGTRYRVFNNSFISLKSRILRELGNMFTSQDYCKYISASDTKSDVHLKIGFIIETFKLGTYNINGGYLPQIFIRVNNPNLLKRLVERIENYNNSILSMVEKRHERSIDILNDFFTASYTNKERWEYIEKYFLGHI